MNRTKIDWAQYTWNPVSGCTKVSEGCRHCYAERHAKRFWGERPFSEVRCHPEKLNEPAGIRAPAHIFVNSMSDLFHPDVPAAFIASVFDVMDAHPQHTFIVLTKRTDQAASAIHGMRFTYDPWPLPNVWLIASVENQESANKRIPELLPIPAVLHGVSIEPMLGPVNLEQVKRRVSTINALQGREWIESDTGSAAMMLPCGAALEWVICGGESGAGARPIQADWVRDLRDQCVRYRTPFFFKQWGGGRRNGHMLDEIEWHQMPVVVK